MIRNRISHFLSLSACIAGAGLLSPLAAETETGFVSLFDGVSFQGWEQSGNWTVEDGAFHRRSAGGPLTYTVTAVPDDFELRFEWKVSQGCNSGLYYRPGQVEYQVLDNIGSPYGENARQAAASIFFCLAPRKDVTRPVGEWNTAKVICQGTVMEHWLNGERVLSFDYADPKWAAYVELLAIRGGDLTGRGGNLWLQDHGQDVSFRNLRWREIPKEEVVVPDPGFKPLPVTGEALEKEKIRVRGMLGKSDPEHAAAREMALYSALDPVVSAEEPLWDSGVSLAKAKDLPVLTDVAFSVIKPYEFKNDGYRFLHGVALCFHKDRLFASFGHNKGGENTDTEEARWSVSDDDGKTWSEVGTIDPGDEPGVGVSHGVFLSRKDELWAFHGAYQGTMEGVHTRAYVLDEKSGSWTAKGTILGEGFWPMQEPVLMDDGNWIMAGLIVGEGNPAGVAISDGENLLKWRVVPIPAEPDLTMWGESTVVVEGSKVTSISRYGEKALALVSTSTDFGRSWSQMCASNLPMATSKPIAGTLSTGARYLICSSSADGGKRRSPLTLCLSKPGETLFSRVLVIRHAEFPEGPGESHAKASLSYPYAMEHDGRLYVGYSNSGGGVGRVGEGRELWNNNSAELAVIPLESLR